MGCFHTLQPSSNAFEPPCIPTLLPHGFVRWQTIQLLLCPDEHSGFLREAVKQFDVVNPSTGTTFPKDIPRHVFPAEPDAEMVKWHDTVGRRLEQEYEASKARKASPQQPRKPELASKAAGSGHPTPFSEEKTPAEQDYFSQHHQQSNASKATRPSVTSRAHSHEAYSPFTRPGPRNEPVDEPPELDADISRAYRHVDPDEVDRADTPRTSSRQSRTRGRSRAPSRRRPSSHRRHRSKTHDPVDSSGYSHSSTDDEDEEEEGVDERYTRSRRGPSSSRRNASHPTDSHPLRGLHSRLLSLDRNAARRHSHDSPLSQARSKIRTTAKPRHHSGSPSPYRLPHPPSNLHQRIQVEIIPSDTDLGTETELETENETDVDPYHPRHAHERELDGESDYNDDAADYTPETKRARDFYYARNRSRPRSRAHDYDRDGPEYIVLPTSNHSASNSGGGSSPTTTTTSSCTAPGSTSPRASRTPSKPIKYKEYILIEPETPRSPPPSMPSFTAPVYATHAQVRRPTPRSGPRYAGGGEGGGTHTPITITTQVPMSSLNGKPSRSGRWGSHNVRRSGSSGSGGSHHLRGTR